MAMALAAAQPCVVGAYSGPGERFATITARPTPGEWRWWRDDGRFGIAGQGGVTCAADALIVDGARWPRIALKQTDVRFKGSDGVELAGRLIEPPIRPNTLPPLVVTVHGSEDWGWIDRAQHPYILAAQGIAVFLYDKRGTGASKGKYNQNFRLLSSDAVAAARTAKRLAAGRYSRFGMVGSSQGGWVAPAAANAAGAQFVAVGYGLLLNPLEEDAEQVATEMRDAGFGADALAGARAVTDATGAVMASHFRDGYARLAEVKARYGTQPWFARIKGEFSGEVLAAGEAELRASGAAKYDNLDIDWRYDAQAHLKAVKAPQLWIVAGADREAPPALTIARLEALRRAGKRIRVVRFPDTDHGMVEFAQAPDGTRAPTRVTDGYFRMVGDWIKGRWAPPYGRAEVLAE